MTPLRGTALLVAFLTEIGALVAAAWALERWAGVTAAIAGVVVLGFSWGLFASPQARWPLAGPGRLVFMVAWFGAAVAAVAYLAGPGWALTAAAVVVGNTVVLRRTGGRPDEEGGAGTGWAGDLDGDGGRHSHGDGDGGG